MKSTARCFVITDNGYEEITYAALEERRAADPAYADRKFIWLHGMLMEAAKTDFFLFCKDKRRQKYIAEEAALNGAFSYNSLDSDGMSGEEIIADDSPLTDEKALVNLALEEIPRCLGRLPEADRDLLTAYYFDSKTERDLAVELGITQPTVNYRRHKAIDRLRKLMGF